MRDLRAGAGCALRWLVIGCTAVSVMTGCRRKPVRHVEEPTWESDAAVVEASVARCAVVASAEFSADLEVGEASAHAQETILGARRSSPDGVVGGLLFIPHSFASATFRAVASLAPDAPPPRPIVTDSRRSVWLYAREDKKRVLVRYDEEAGQFAPHARIVQPSDASFAFDVLDGGARTLVAWDEDTSSPARGAIRVAAVEGDLVRPAEIVSGSADADSPRLLPRQGGGFWAFWLAHQVVTGDAGPAALLERPGEDREHVWLEAQALGADLKPVGEARRLSGRSGHVSDFVVWQDAEGAHVAYRDDAEAVSGARVGDLGGGRVLHTKEGHAGFSQPNELVTGGLGRGDLAAAEISGQVWLAYPLPGDAVVFAPIHQLAAPRIEPELASSRIVASLGAEVLAVTGRAARKLRCH